MSLKWNEYTVHIRFRERLVGGIPVLPEGQRANAYESWARGQGVEPSDAEELADKLAEDPDMPVAAEEIEGLHTGFRADEKGIYIEARQVKAMIREASQRLGLIKRVRGTRQVIQHDVHVRAKDGTQKLYFGMERPTGTDQRAISVVTRQGPRTAIKTFDFVQEGELEFVVRVLAGGVGDGLVGEDELQAIMELGGELGLGADRSQGEGTFDVLSFEQTN
jgi:hypothetical protein